MVTVYCPMAAVLLAVSVSVLFPVVGFGGEGGSHATGQTGHREGHVAAKSILGGHVDIRCAGGALANAYAPTAREGEGRHIDGQREGSGCALAAGGSGDGHGVLPEGGGAARRQRQDSASGCGFGFHSAVVPLGRPDTARRTLPVNPYL